MPQRACSVNGKKDKALQFAKKDMLTGMSFHFHSYEPGVLLGVQMICMVRILTRIPPGNMHFT